VGDATGLILGLIAAAMWGTLDVLVAFAGRRIGGVASAALVVGSSCLMILALAVVTGTGLPSDPSSLTLALAAGSVSSIGFACFYTALRLGPVSVVSPTVAVYGGLASVLAIVFLGERPAAIQLLGAAAATAGIALIGLTFGRGRGRPRFSGPGVPFALVSLVAWSVSIVLLSIPIREAGWLSASAAARIANALLLVGLWVIVWRRGAARPGEPALAPEPELPLDVEALTAGGHPGALDGESGPAPRGRALAAMLGRHHVEILLAAGFLETCGFIAFSYALGVAPAWLVSLASSLGPTVTVAAGVVLFGERPRPVQWAGIGLVFAGIALVAIG
jgi:drug/metabolite transporter (DMT)-like permease